MALRSWLAGLKCSVTKRQTRRRRHRGSRVGIVTQGLEIRTLLSAVSFTAQTGSSHPLNGFDVGQYSSPTMGDLDGDGDLDVIVGLSNGTFKYYKNTGTAIAPVFAEQTGTDNPLDGVDVGSYSIPTLGDLDGDGDLDLITGNDDGTFNYFRNTGTALVPTFTAQTFSNNPLNGFDVGDSSAPALGDLDGDGDLDLISGAFNGRYYYYLNTGTAKSPSFTEQTGSANPLNGKDVGFSSVPAMADVDGDGDLDVIAGENSGNFKYYLNTGTAVAPVFVELTGNANPLNGKHVNSNSTPAFGDLDGDGDVDLVSGEFEGTLKYFLNTTVPVDEIGFVNRTGTDNPLNGEDVGSLSLQVLGDLDGDGDLDLIAGNSLGTLDYFKNTGTAIAPVYAKQTGANNPLDGVYLGFSTAPALGDLDGDGDLDLIVGNDTGVFAYYKNTGTAIAPVFVSQTGSNNPLDGFDAGTNSAPTLGDLDGDGDLDLIVGNSDGTFKYYKNTGTAKAPVFVDQTGSDNPLNGEDVGVWSTPALGDVDGDGDLDLVVGEQGGTFIYYKNTGTATAPMFVSQTGSNNPLNGKDAGDGSSAALGDLDGDGDLDLVSGELNGVFKFYEQNRAPNDISLSSSNIAENSSSGSTVGTFSSTDLDSGNTFTYTLVTGTGDTDNASFTIVGDELRTAEVFNFEVKNSYSIRVRTTDQDGKTFEEAFTIHVTNVNEMPTNIALSNNSVEENSAVNTPVGAFMTADPDSGNTFTYTLVSGTGDTDNALFTISGNQLQTAAVLNFEMQQSYSIRVRSTDQGSLGVEKVFTINATDVNEMPTNIGLTNNSVSEESPVNSPVGLLNTADPDSGNTFTYTLVSGAGDTDNALFTIVSNQLRTAAVFNFELQETYTIRVRSTDQGNLSVEKAFTITITNVNEAPVLIAGFFPQLPDRWRKDKTNAGETIANIIDSVTPDELITDQDSGASEGFAVIDATQKKGTWEYSIDDGATWNSLADASTTNARLLNEAAKLRFVPFKKKFKGDFTLTVVAWDQTTGTNGGTADVTTRGDATAFSLETSLVTHTVLKKKPKV